MKTCITCSEYIVSKRSTKKFCDTCLSEKRKAYNREYRKTEIAKELKAAANRKIRELAYSGYGSACSCCGESEFEFLCIDHVYGGGARDRKKHSTYQIARRVIELGFPDEYQVLCHNCNLAKGFFGECPHQRKRIS